MKIAIAKIFSLLFLALSVLPVATAQQQVDELILDKRKNIFNLLSQNEVLEVSVETDIDKIITNKYLDEPTAAVFQINNGRNNHSEYNVSLSPRGKYRLKVCDFPPIKIKFDKSEFSSEKLDSHESLKLVTHCKEFEDSEDIILKEYLVYKIYNIISDQSFRVQLVKINWIDSKGNHDIDEQWGFIIESEKQMAKRLGAKVYDEEAISHQEINKLSAAQTSLYQYMIGNPDWKMAPLQNLSILKPKKQDEYLTIPYDFDFCGLVGAPYSVTEFKLYSTKERIYLGESDESDLKSAMELFKSKKKLIISEIKSFEHIQGSTRREILKYIRSFFATFNQPLMDKAFYKERFEKRK